MPNPPYTRRSPCFPVAWCLACERTPKGRSAGTDQATRLGSIGPLQIGIDAVIRPKVDAYLEGDRSYRDVMSDLVVRTVQQHLRVAWSRFAAPRGKDVSVLIADNDTWARNRVFRPGRTGSRLPMAIDWLDQLKLTSEAGLYEIRQANSHRSIVALGYS